MTYYPTADDLRLLKYHNKELHCKIDLLDKNMAVIDSLEGLTIDGSISVDADSDIRRTFSSTIYLNEKHSISKYTIDEWINKYVRVYIGMNAPGKDVHWYNQGVFAFNQNGFTYSETEHLLSINCVDLVAKLDGSLGGQLTGVKTKIPAGSNIKEAIISTFELSGLTDCMIDYWDRTVPYDLEYGTGSTVWSILTELRDLYYPFEMYFDDNVFICDEIPTGYEDQLVLDEKVFNDCVISESADVDYSEVKNCVEVFGATLDTDYYAETCSYSNGQLSLALKDASLSDDVRIAFVSSVDITAEQISVTVQNTATADSSIVTAGPFLLYQATTDANGQDVVQDASVIKKDNYYIIRYSPEAKRFYYIGQQIIHAMVKLVDSMPSAAEIELQQQEENCNNIKFICLNDMEESSSLYNSRFSIEQIGQRNEVLSGGEYENYTTDADALAVAEYEHWKRCRLTDPVNVSMLLIPWLNVNQKISYAPKYMNTDEPVEFLIKKNKHHPWQRDNGLNAQPLLSILSVHC